MFNDSVKPIADAGKADLVASDARLSDEITLIPTPGHSPGHMSIHIKSDGQEGLLTGDVAHHPCQMAHLDWSSTADSDPKQSAVTRRELFGRFADTPTLVIGGHFNAGHIKREGDALQVHRAGVMVPLMVRSASSRVSNHAGPEYAWRIASSTRPKGASSYEDEDSSNARAGQSAVEFPRPLFHEAFQVKKPLREQYNEACSLRRDWPGKARPDR